MSAIIGIDPGLVDTGLVWIALNQEKRAFSTEHKLVTNLDYDEIVAWVNGYRTRDVFIEAYRPRSAYQTDARMGAAVNEIRRRLPGSTTLNNTGVKQVVKQDLMELLGVWKFKTRAHHQDLRSAARIGLYGLLKNPEWNKVLAALVMDHLDNRPWTRV